MPAAPGPTPQPAAPGTDGRDCLTSELLYRLGVVLRRRLDAALDDAGLGLRTRHYAVLSTLAFKEPMSQKAAADAADIDPATMVKTVDELERQGLVTRERNPRDRRAHELALTPAGRAMLARAESLLAGIEDAVFAPLGESGVVRLRAWLVEMLARAEQRLD